MLQLITKLKHLPHLAKMKEHKQFINSLTRKQTYTTKLIRSKQISSTPPTDTADDNTIQQISSTTQTELIIPPHSDDNQVTDDDETMSLDGKESAYTVSDSDSDIETDDNQTGNNQFDKLLENQSAKDKPNSNLVFDEENPKVNLLAPPLPQIDYPWNLLPEYKNQYKVTPGLIPNLPISNDYVDASVDDGHQAEPMSRRHGSIPMNQVDPSLLVTGFKNIFQKYLKQKEADSSKGVESNIEASTSGLQGDHFQTDSHTDDTTTETVLEHEVVEAVVLPTAKKPKVLNRYVYNNTGKGKLSYDQWKQLQMNTQVDLSPGKSPTLTFRKRDRLIGGHDHTPSTHTVTNTSNINTTQHDTVSHSQSYKVPNFYNYPPPSYAGNQDEDATPRKQRRVTRGKYAK